MTTPLPHNITWNFPQSERDTKICPKCGEANPQDAVMCWACYIPLSAEGSPANSEFRRKANVLRRAEQWRERRRIWSAAFFSTLPVYGVLLLIASGYVPECRALFIVTGIACFIASHTWSNYQQRQRARYLAEEGEPVERIANTILYYALRDGARTIVLRAGVMGVECEYRIENEWRPEMHIPPYVWEPLRDHLAGRSDNWEHPIPFEQQGVNGNVVARLEHLFPHQTIVLRLDSPT